jgi:hypothetical protein
MILSRRLMMAAVSFEYNNFALFTASGTFNVPAGVTTAAILFSGGGGGGSTAYNNDATVRSQNGGNGGLGFNIVSLTPSSAQTIVIGSGGNGYSGNSGPGQTGGSTIAFGLTATGGARGTSTTDGSQPNAADGTAPTSSSITRSNISPSYDLLDAPEENKTVILALQTQGINSSTTAASYSEAGSFQGGIRGTRGNTRTNNDGAIISQYTAKGGIGGFVAIWY